ncbi:PadR family transcriptional regulator [Romboutsia weinsteinii]|uniref:PadR family transcriptional regulator n=1 Tax=Romboutsia weinsteinii TaxID=2020949 RepID=A0A371J2A6_9FIRM|nr:PadR family transcriptional regulator [Romboutsia weinsteinii]RDY26941.1 PadR family transcriptional regulator [Romboutsia weinsteinii]
MGESFQQGALTEATYYILLALCEPRHGYGIMQYITEISNNRVNLGAGTLYGALNTLVEKQWIKSVSTEIKSRKKEYVITESGIEVLKEEMKRLEELLQTGKVILKGE